MGNPGVISVKEKFSLTSASPHTIAFSAYGTFWMFNATIFIPGSESRKSELKLIYHQIIYSQMYGGHPGKDTANRYDVIFFFRCVPDYVS